jgi:hypothetical protein
MFESVALDRWTHMPVNSYDKTKLVPMTGNDGEYYKQAAAWAQAFTWWGYVRDVETDGTPKAINFNEFNNTLTDWQASGGSVFYVNGVATIGDPTLAGAGAFSTTESEVHAVFRWGSDEVNAVLQQTDGWLLLKQMMYDFHSAGLIVSAASNTTTAYHGVTAAEFLQFVVELHENPSLPRPVPFVPSWDSTTYHFISKIDAVDNPGGQLPGVPSTSLWNDTTMAPNAPGQVINIYHYETYMRGVGALTTVPNWVAVYSATKGWQRASGSVVYSTNRNWDQNAGLVTAGEDVYLIGYLSDPGDVTTWPPYDGPTS